MAAFTVILPHKRNPGNDKALAICLDCLYANTLSDFILISDAAYDQPLYERVNRMVEQANTDYCLYLASDTFLAPCWDVPMLEAINPNTFITGVLVEPGAIALHDLNLHKDFGRKPDTFRRAAFEAWSQSSEAPILNGEGWPCPYLFPRDGWLAFGGLEVGLQGDAQGFTSADMQLWDRWKAAGNFIVRVKSYAYHLQRWSELDEQTAEKREMQS